MTARNLKQLHHVGHLCRPALLLFRHTQENALRWIASASVDAESVRSFAALGVGGVNHHPKGIDLSIGYVVCLPASVALFRQNPTMLRDLCGQSFSHIVLSLQRCGRWSVRDCSPGT
jgi:hypothetical protein